MLQLPCFLIGSRRRAHLPRTRGPSHASLLGQVPRTNHVGECPAFYAETPEDHQKVANFRLTKRLDEARARQLTINRSRVRFSLEMHNEMFHVEKNMEKVHEIFHDPFTIFHETCKSTIEAYEVSRRCIMLFMHNIMFIHQNGSTET